MEEKDGGLFIQLGANAFQMVAFSFIDSQHGDPDLLVLVRVTSFQGAHELAFQKEIRGCGKPFFWGFDSP